MKIVFVDRPLAYDGLQLCTGFMDTHAPCDGDSLVAFMGLADVPSEHMVDLEDADAGLSIYSPLMTHMLIEHRGMSLREGVLAQRLLVRHAAEWTAARSGATIEVRGDDLYVLEGKLSVSIATTSPRGVLIHFGVNVDTDGAPVKAHGLRDLRVAPEEFLRGVARAYEREMDSISHAVGKVRPVT